MKNPVNPVQAYAAVSPDGRIDYDAMGLSENTARAAASDWYEPEKIPLTFIPVTILPPPEQYEAMVAVIAAAKDLQSEPTCTTHVGYDEGGNFLYAETVRTDMGAFNDLSRALAALKEQDHG